MKISLLVAIVVIIAATLLVWRKKPVNDSVEDADEYTEEEDVDEPPTT